MHMLHKATAHGRMIDKALNTLQPKEEEEEDGRKRRRKRRKKEGGRRMKGRGGARER